MSATRNYAIAYGDPTDLESYIIVGGDNEDFFLHSHEYTETYDSLQAAIRFSVTGRGSTEDEISADFADRIEKLKLLEAYSRDLIVAAGVEEEWTDADVASEVFDFDVGLTVTQIQVSTTPFVASHVGALITALGRTYRIYKVVNSSTVNCTLTAGVPAGTGITNDTPCKLLNTLYETVESTRTKAYRCRSELRPVGDQLDSPFRRTFTCVLSFIRPADDSRDQGGRLAAQYRVTEATTGIRRVQFKGMYTGIGANNSVVQFGSNFSTWRDTILTSLGGGFEAEGELTYETDDEFGTTVFDASYIELNERQTIAEVDSSLLSIQSMAIVRDNTYEMGVPGEIPPARVTVVYAIRVNKSVTTDGYLTDLYKNTIRPHIFAQLRAKNDGNEFILEREIPVINAPRNFIQVTIEVELIDPGASTLLEFSRTVRYMVKSRKTNLDTWSPKKLHKRLSFSPSPSIIAVVTAVERRRDVDPSVTFPDGLTKGIAASAPSFVPEREETLFQVPGRPPGPEAILGDGENKWHYQDYDVFVTDTVRGAANPAYGALDGQVVEDVVYETTVTSIWLWGEEVQLDNPGSFAPLDGDFITPSDVLPSIEG